MVLLGNKTQLKEKTAWLQSLPEQVDCVEPG
jgi:hypothetical protein